MSSKQKGYSYLSIIIALVVILTLSLSFISASVISNNSSNMASQQIVSFQVANSFLELSEAELKNYLTKDTMDESLLNYIYQSIEMKTDVFNTKYDLLDVSVYFHCNSLCENLSNTDYRLLDRVYLTNEVEVSIVVKYNYPNASGDLEEGTTVLNRLVVLDS